MLQLSDIPDLVGLSKLATLDELARSGGAKFALAANRFHQHERKKEREKKARRGIKKLIRPENAFAVVPLLPEHEDDRLHCILRGDFVLCDLIPAIIANRGACSHVRIATLGLSAANAESLANLKDAGLIGELTIVASHYFQQVDKTTTFKKVATILDGRAKLVITRSHAKVILMPTTAGDWFVIEGSANLRSSDNIEQMLILNDRETHDFHAEWMEGLSHAD
jgi:hypothetical protein